MDCDDFAARMVHLANIIIPVIISHPKFHSRVSASNHFGSKSKGIAKFNLSARLQNFIFINGLVKAI